VISFLRQFEERVDCRFLGKNDDREIVDPYVRLHQVHGNTTIVARQPMLSTEQADGVITDAVGLPLAIRAADCQNFAVYAPEAHVGGVLHAGWSGMIQEAMPAFFDRLKAEFGVDARDCYVAAGPSLCLECAEYKDPEFELRQKVDSQYVVDGHVDLQKIATDQLVKLGIHSDHIERHPDCTRCHSEKYLTYRGGDRAQVQSGVSNILVLTLL